MIRQYRIHLHHVDIVLEVLLPYHDTQVFGRMMKIANIDKYQNWHLLQGVKQSGVPLPR